MERRTLTRNDDSAVTQRVRIGLTGLSCVFLLVLLAASVFGLMGDNPPPPAGAVMANGTAAAEPSGDPPKEPLAELGVAPGNVPDPPIANDSTRISVRVVRPGISPAR